MASKHAHSSDPQKKCGMESEYHVHFHKRPCMQKDSPSDG